MGYLFSGMLPRLGCQKQVGHEVGDEIGAALVAGGAEAGQAVADQGAAKMRPQNVKHHVLAAAGVHAIDRAIGRREAPQPRCVGAALGSHVRSLGLQSRPALPATWTPSDPPTGFVDVDGRLRAQPRHQFEERSLGFLGHTMHGLHQSPGRNPQAAQRIQHLAGASRGQTQMLVEQRSQRPRMLNAES